MKGLSIVATILLLVFAGVLTDYLHSKGALPHQQGDRATVASAPRGAGVPSHLQPPLNL